LLALLAADLATLADRPGAALAERTRDGMGASLYQTAAAACAEAPIKSQRNVDARWINRVRKAGTTSEEAAEVIFTAATDGTDAG
jgi:hypothetical protein